MYSRLDDDYLNENLSRDEMKVMSNIPDSVRETNTLVHSDLHPGNIMLRDGELMLIDMGGVTKGTPVYDMACTYRVLCFLPKFDPDICRRSFGLEPEAALKIGRDYFAGYTGIDDPAKLDEYIARIRLVFCFSFILGISTSPARDDHGRSIIDKIFRGIVIPNADEIGSILAQ